MIRGSAAPFDGPRLPQDMRVVISDDPEKLKVIAPKRTRSLRTPCRRPAEKCSAAGRRVRWMHSWTGVDGILVSELLAIPRR